MCQWVFACPDGELAGCDPHAWLREEERDHAARGCARASGVVETSGDVACQYAHVECGEVRVVGLLTTGFGCLVVSLPSV